jgi:hypothetical protein
VAKDKTASESEGVGADVADVDDIAGATRGSGADVADVDDIAGARGLDADVDDVAGVEGVGDNVAGAEGVDAGADDVAGDAEVVGAGVDCISALDAVGVFSVSDSLLSVSKISLDLCFFRALFSSDCLVRGRFLP